MRCARLNSGAGGSAITSLRKLTLRKYSKAVHKIFQIPTTYTRERLPHLRARRRFNALKIFIHAPGFPGVEECGGKVLVSSDKCINSKYLSKKWLIHANNRLDFRPSPGSGLVEKRRLISRTEAGNRAYFLKTFQVLANEKMEFVIIIISATIISHLEF